MKTWGNLAGMINWRAQIQIWKCHFTTWWCCIEWWGWPESRVISSCFVFGFRCTIGDLRNPVSSSILPTPPPPLQSELESNIQPLCLTGTMTIAHNMWDSSYRRPADSGRWSAGENNVFLFHEQVSQTWYAHSYIQHLDALFTCVMFLIWFWDWVIASNAGGPFSAELLMASSTHKHKNIQHFRGSSLIHFHSNIYLFNNVTCGF